MLKDVNFQPGIVVFPAEGKFIIYLVKDFNWTEPIIKKSCKDLDALYKNIYLLLNLLKDRSTLTKIRE